MSLTPLEKAASGALASAIANTLVYPLDLSKTIIQTQVKKHDSGSPMSGSESEIMSTSTGADSVFVERKKRELKYKNTVDVLRQIRAKKGVLGWYHGLVSSILGSAAQNFSYFYWYSLVKLAYSRLTKTAQTHRHSTAIELFLGALAAAISQLFTMPIGVITTQQQTDKQHRSLYTLAKEIYLHDGVHGFWKGLKVSLVLCVNPSITYGSYERLKQIFFENKEYLGPLESFTLGMCAKSLATLATQPLIVSKAMLQKKVAKNENESDGFTGSDEIDDGDIKFATFGEAIQHLWETEKVRGLYKGVAPQLLKGVIVQGLLFMCKDQIDILFVALLEIVKRRKSLRLKR
ncbi:hypothetical protein OXX80_001515 [Metschnikowia pulcherrima]